MISAPSWCGSASRRGGRAVGRSRTGATAHPDLGFDQGWPGFMITERAAPPACRAGGRSHAQQIAGDAIRASAVGRRTAEHTSELQLLMSHSYPGFRLKKTTSISTKTHPRSL